jgi:hypothetical protein
LVDRSGDLYPSAQLRVRKEESTNDVGDAAAPLKEEERALLTKLEDDYRDIRGDIEEQAGIVRDFGDSRSARVPWLERLGFPSHTAGLKDDQLPRAATAGAGGDGGADAELVRIIQAAESVLRDAYALCSNTSPSRRMTQQRANILNEFYAGASGRSDGFQYYKNPSTLVKYFATFKKLLAYLFRVAVADEDGEDRHFTRTDAKQRLPGQVRCLPAAIEAPSRRD